MASLNDVATALSNVQPSLDAAKAQIQSIVQNAPANSGDANSAQAALTALAQLQSQLAGVAGTLASVQAGAQAGAQAAQQAAPAPAPAAPAPPAPTGVSTGATATIAVGTALVGGIVGWIAKGASMRETPRSNPARRLR